MTNHPSQSGTEVILLVEDEDMVSDLTKRILEGAGYTTLAAANGKEAVVLYEKEMDRISLVILDLIMPEMGGIKCLGELHKINPNVKVVIVSGHTVDGAMKEKLGTVARGFVNKPYSIKQLLQIVRDVLKCH